MVEELFRSQGAALDDTVFKLASDISADQTSEIERMQKNAVHPNDGNTRLVITPRSHAYDPVEVVVRRQSADDGGVRPIHVGLAPERSVARDAMRALDSAPGCTMRLRRRGT